MTHLLELAHIEKRFGGLIATNDVSFHVNKGESLGLVGPNGAGKTTLFNMIMGEVRQNSGTIRLDGQDISRLPTHARIQQGVARTYQIPRPFADMTIAENIRIGLMPDNISAMLLQPPDLSAERTLAQSVGFDAADLSRPVHELSMGDLRKLELARTLATEPEVLLLDEVFAGLTVGEIAHMSDLLQSKRRDGMTYVIVSHDLRALEPLVDRVVALAQGTKIAEGTFGAVMADEEVRAAYLGTA